MLITTLGTSHGDHTYCRFNSSTLFEIGNSLYLIDSGAPVNGLMVRAKKNFGQVRAVFITHMHDDHVGGLPGLIKTLLKYPVSGQHTNIYLPEESGINALGVWLKAQHLPWPSRLITVDTVREGLIYSDGTLSVRAVATQHIKHPDYPISFAYHLEAEGKRIMYTGDLSADFSDFPGILQDEHFHLCICECTHYSPHDALPILKKCKLDRIIFNHIHNPWHGEGEEKLRKIMSDLPYEYEIAHDGDKFAV